MLRTRTRLAAGFAALVAAIVTAPAASAAYPVGEIKKEHLQFGATYMTGTVTFYNRSVGIKGPAHFVGCRTIHAWSVDIQGSVDKILDYGSTSPKCDRDYFVDIPLEANIPGGAERVVIELRDGAGKAFSPRVYRAFDLV